MSHALAFPDWDYSVNEVRESPAFKDIELTIKKPSPSPRAEIRASEVADTLNELYDLLTSEQITEVIFANAVSLWTDFLGRLPAVEPYASDLGSVCFDWDEDPNCQLAVIVQADGRIAHSALIGDLEIRDTEELGSLLPRLQAVTQQWLAHGSPLRD